MQTKTTTIAARAAAGLLAALTVTACDAAGEARPTIDDIAPPSVAPVRGGTGVGVVPAAFTAPADGGNTSCTADSASRTTTVAVDGGTATIKESNGAITVNGAACASVSKTRRLVVTGSGKNEHVRLHPGLPRTSIDLKSQPRQYDWVSLLRSDAADRIVIGSRGADTDGDGDLDVSVANVEIWQVYARGGNDEVSGQGSAATGEPTRLRTYVFGGTGADRITGGNRNDRLQGDTGNDQIDGRAGHDVARYVDAPSKVRVDLSEDRATGGDGTDRLVNVEGATGSRHNDVVLGDDGNNTLGGYYGKDTVHGRGGDDRIGGGPGFDRVAGGGGQDYATFIGELAAVDADIRLQNAVTRDGVEKFSDIEHLVGSVHDDTLTGDDNRNVIFGHAGNDALVGLGGHDAIVGAAGNDAISAGRGDDVVQPGVGDDVAHGGVGDDVVTYANLSADGDVTIDLEAGTATGAGGDDAIPGFERARGAE